VPITPRTVFCLASLAKQFVGMCVLLLEEEGRLSLDDNIRDYVPELPDYGAPITIAHLLYQTSGLRDYMVQALQMTGLKVHDFLTEEEAMQIVIDQRDLIFLTGTRFHYSNTNYLLLSILVKRVTGETLGTYAERVIFRPLGMKNTFFREDQSKIIKHRATGYAEFPLQNVSPREYELAEAEREPYYTLTSDLEVTGDDGVWSTLEDMYLWDQNFDHNRLGQGRQELIERFLTSGTTADGSVTGYACGICVGENQGKTVHEHNGWFTGYLAVIERYPDQQTTLLLFSNNNRLLPWSYTEEIRNVLFGEETEETVDEPSLLSEEADVAIVVGSYLCQENGYIWHIREIDGRLSASVNGEWEMGLSSLGGQQFRTSTGYDVTPVYDEGGALLHLQVTRGEQEFLFRPFTLGKSTDEELLPFTGTYHCAEMRTTFDVRIEDGRLCLWNHNRHRTALDLAFTRALGDVFYTYDAVVDGVMIEFLRTQGGLVEAFVFRSRAGDRREQLRYQKQE